MVKAEQILRYWFGALDNELSKQSQSSLWYQSTATIDLEITSQFNHLYSQAVEQPFTHWLDNARGSLAYIILLDQLPRNMFRGKDKAFSSDNKALAAAQEGISKGFDKKLALIERIFYYHPFEHSEDLAVQQDSVRLFKQLLAEYPSEIHQAVIKIALDFAIEHLEIIEKFGRFPHRNKVLNRQPTQQELEYLKLGNDFGQSAKG